MESFCGARSAIAFENSTSIPDPSSLTYEGLFSENYFKLQSPTDKEKDVEISQAQVKNPITGQTEQYLGLLVKSKYDGVGIRQPIDISVTVDISSSMSAFVGSSGLSRLELAKQACTKLIKLLGKDDHLAFSTFNYNSERIFPLTQGDQFTQQHIDNINSIQTNGGTILPNALADCYDIMKTSTNKNRRIIFITDLEDNCNDQGLINLFSKCADEGIYITVIGISYDCNTSLAEVVTHTKGCNYFIAGKEEDLDKYLVHDFNYICFPSGFDVSVEFKSSNLKITRSIGAGFNVPKEHVDKDNEWRIKNHKERSQFFKDKVNNVLLYFKRMNKRLPMPVLATFCNFLRFDKKAVCEINTCFPSGLTKKDNDSYMEGGMILLKLNKENTVSEYSGEIALKFTTLDGQKHVQTYSVRCPKFMSNNDFFSDQNIQNALSLYYYAKWCRRIMRAENCYNEKQDKQLLQQKFREELNELSSTVKQFLEINCREYITSKKNAKLKKVDDLIKLVDEKIRRDKINEIERKEYNEEQAKEGLTGN